MPRRRRSDLPDGAFHVISHAVASERLFHDDLDRRRYLGVLQQVVERYGWRVLTLVLLDNHVHLLVVTAARELSGALWWLNWNYARHYQRHHPHRRGHVFESRPKTLPVRSERYLLAVLRYVANNPVKAGVCSRPETYPWSAHRAILGRSSRLPIVAAEEVLSRFGDEPTRARARYAAFVAGEDAAEDDEVRLWSDGPPSDRPPLPEILRFADPVDAARSAHLRWGYTVRAIASVAGVDPATISRRIKRGA